VIKIYCEDCRRDVTKRYIEFTNPNYYLVDNCLEKIAGTENEYLYVGNDIHMLIILHDDESNGE
jgi:threonine dehydrogenase-like Zn-dependent dehydrogenase